MLRLIERFGDDDGDRFSEEAYFGALQHVKPFSRRRIDRSAVFVVGKPLRVEVAYDSHDARHFLNRCAVNRFYSTEPDSTAHDDCVGLAFLVELGRVCGLASDLQAAVDARQGFTDSRRHATSPAISSARTIVAGRSFTLNPLWERGRVSSVETAAAIS